MEITRRPLFKKGGIVTEKACFLGLSDGIVLLLDTEDVT